MVSRQVCRPRPAPTSWLPQPVPFHRTLIPPTDLYYHPAWVAQREMDAGRPKRIRASINYVEPTELDEDIVDDEALDESAVTVASDDPPTDTDDATTTVVSDSDSGSDQEFTTDKVLPKCTIVNAPLTLSRESSKPSRRRSRPRRPRRSRRSKKCPSASWICHPKSAS